MNLLLALRPKVSRLGRSGLLQKLNDDCWLPASSWMSTVHGIINDLASTYLALHYTPLYYLLSVSGQSWVFNKKVTDFNVFVEHQKLLGEWCKSSTAAIATVFAARALNMFLKLKASSDREEDRKGKFSQQQAVHWTDISDYWGAYVCSLICWAFGIEDKQDRDNTKNLPKAPKQWILTVADLEPSELQAQNHRNGAQKVMP
ncbi:hypothetical protein FVER14953_20697 [Fusarium verticillioides]|nr:hypothetical protein FVER14953_20697 [Fusarium verticillioides]